MCPFSPLSCFIGDVRVFFGAFLGPIFAVLLFNTAIFILVGGVLVKHNRNKVGNAADYKSQRKSNIRLTISLFGIMSLFGLTWVLAAFTFRGASLAFQILFAVFNSLQGFFIFVFFCVLSSDVRQLWLEVVCGRRIKQSTYSTGGKGYSSGQQNPGAKKGPKTASSGLSSVPAERYTSNSIELSENPSSTVFENSNTSPGFEQGYTSNAPLPLTYQPPARSRAHFTTEAYRGSPATEESMEMSINFQ